MIVKGVLHRWVMQGTLGVIVNPLDPDGGAREAHRSTGALAEHPGQATSALHHMYLPGIDGPGVAAPSAERARARLRQRGLAAQVGAAPPVQWSRRGGTPQPPRPVKAAAPCVPLQHPCTQDQALLVLC